MKKIKNHLTVIAALLSISATVISGETKIEDTKRAESDCYMFLADYPPDLPPYTGRNVEILPSLYPIDEPTDIPIIPEQDCPTPTDLICCFFVGTTPGDIYYVTGIWYGVPEI